MGSAQQTPKCPQWIAAGRGGLYRPAQSSSLPTPSPPSAADRLKQPLEVVCVAVCGELTTAQQALLQLLLRKLDTDESELAWIDQQMELLFAPYTRQMELLDSIPGIDTLAAATILAEIGPQPQAHFATPAHLAFWAGLVPRNDESAGKVKSRSILPGNPYLKVILCQVAWVAVRRRGSRFHAWFWSHQARLGKKKAIIAVSHKLLILIYKLLERDQLYDPEYRAAA